MDAVLFVARLNVIRRGMFAQLHEVLTVPADVLGVVVTDVGLSDDFRPYTYEYKYEREPVA